MRLVTFGFVGSFLMALASCVAVPEVNADTIVTWEVEDATLPYGDVLTGSFDYDATTNQYSNIDLIHSCAGPCAPYASVAPPETWVTSDLNEAISSGLFLLNSASAGLLLTFEQPLTDAGGTDGFANIYNPSFVIFPMDGYTMEPNIIEFDTGYVQAVAETTTVSEPSSISIGFLGALGLIGVAQRRRIRGAA